MSRKLCRYISNSFLCLLYIYFQTFLRYNIMIIFLSTNTEKGLKFLLNKLSLSSSYMSTGYIKIFFSHVINNSFFKLRNHACYGYDSLICLNLNLKNVVLKNKQTNKYKLDSRVGLRNLYS